MQVLTKKNTFIMLSTLMVAFVAYAFFAGPTISQAVDTSIVGSLAVELRPYGAQSLLEDVTLTYNGVNDLILDNWQLLNEDGVVYTFPVGTTLVSGAGSLFCTVENTIVPACIKAWSGDAWSDTAGSFTLLNAEGELVVTKTYSDVEESEKVYFTKDFAVTVYERNDAILVCHLDKQGKYSGKKERAWKLMSGNKGHVTHEGDILPPFHYKEHNAISYFPGLNWETLQDTYNQFCNT